MNGGFQKGVKEWVGLSKARHENGTLKSSGDGVFALSSSRDVTVGVTGDLTTTAGRGIYAKGNNAISVTVGGTLKSSGYGVVAQSNSQGVTVKTGNVTSTGGKGIYAKGHNDIYVKAGAVHSSGDAVFTDSQTTQVTIKTSGDITSDLGRGLYATGHSNITITSVGKVQAHGDAVFATNDINNGSSINVTQTGDVSSTTGHGIYAAGHASVMLTSTGVVQADDDAVYALSQKSTAGITQGGNVTSTKGYGLYADGWAAVTIGGAGGDVQAKKDGIRAVSSNSSTSITWNGDVSSGTSAAIFTTAHAAITVGSTGDLTSFTDGIYAKNASTATIGITQTGDITAGGSAINAISSGGEVDVTTDGNLAGDTDGIVLSSTGKLSVTVNGGSVKGATAGVLFSQGSVDSLINHGAIKNSAGIGGDAIVAAADQLTVDNYGTVTGNVRLSSLGNSFANHAGSLFEMGTTVNLGTGNLLTNDGTLSPGGVGSIAATTLTGGLVNNNGGILALDVDWQHGQIDQIAASGGAALDGKVAVNVQSLPAASDAPLAFVTANGGTSVDTLATLNPVLAGDISYPDADHADLTSALNFSPTGLSSGSAKVGDYLNQSYGGGGLSATDPLLLSLANMTSLGSVDAALQQLAPNAYLSAKTEAVYGASAFTDSLMSCKVPDGVAKFSLEGQCVWERADGGSTTITSEDGTGFTAHQRELAAGGQQPLDKDLRLGFAGGVLQTGLTDATGATTTGQTVEAGGVLKYAPGGILLAASLAGSYGRDETIRPAAGTTFIGEGSIATIDARARAAYTFETANWYVKPQADLDVTYVYGGALESGAPAALRLAATGQAVLSATPALEVGGQVDAGEVTLRPYARAGVSLYANQNITGGVSLASDTSGDSFSIGATSDQALYRLSAGIDVLGSNGMDFRAFYDGVVGASTRSQSGGLKFSYAF